MKLLEALRLINEASASERPVRTYVLACGFTPLALETFVQAHLQERQPDVRVSIRTGLFGDLVGTLERAAAARDLDGLAVVVEWSDLDPRLGWRNGARVGAAFGAEVIASTRMAAGRLARAIEKAAAVHPIALCAPTLPIPPVFLATAGTASGHILELRTIVAEFEAHAATVKGVRVVDRQAIDVASPLGEREDIRSDLLTSFPYQRTHAAFIGDAIAAVLRPAPTKKGIITDLDDTLWRGIVGEVGAAGVQWDLDHGAQAHGIYQRTLAALAGAGVLVGVASKNDPVVVDEAFRRHDLILPSDAVFPIHASWGQKSAAVAAILDTWNVGADSVVFVDDSPLEIAEVRTRFPAIEGILFDGTDAMGVGRVVARLHALFGKSAIQDEDRLRAASLRAAVEMRASAAEADDVEAFLGQLDAHVSITFSRDLDDARAFELVNKTNQFNLNGRRWTEGEWRLALQRPGAFLMTADYRDKFGPLGKIAVALGTLTDREVHVDAWVLSCRAFSRRVEDVMLRALFNHLDAGMIYLDFVRTPRNGPTQTLVSRYAEMFPERGIVRIDRERFSGGVPTLYQSVDVVDKGGVARTAPRVPRIQS